MATRTEFNPGLMEHRIDRLEEDVSEIKHAVSNDLPHLIQRFGWRIVFFILGTMSTLGIIITLIKILG